MIFLANRQQQLSGSRATALFGDALVITPPFVMTTVILLTAWIVYSRTTFRSLGAFGLTLVVSFCSIIVWRLIGIDSISIMTYILLLPLVAILATSMSWSHIRHRISGPADVDEIDE